MTTTSEAGLTASSDEQQLAFASSHNRVFVTHDADFLRLHKSGLSHAGTVYCLRAGRSVREVLHGLILISELLSPEEMQNHIEFI